MTVKWPRLSLRCRLQICYHYERYTLSQKLLLIMKCCWMNTLIPKLSWIRNTVIKADESDWILQEIGVEKIYKNISSMNLGHVVLSISNTSKVNPTWSETQCENDWFKNLNKKRILTFHHFFCCVLSLRFQTICNHNRKW